MARPVKRTRGERGQALIEFAFIAPFLLVLLMTIVDFGIALDRREVIQHAVREGARYGAVGHSETEIQDRASDQSQGVLDPEDVTVCYVDGPSGSPTAGVAGSSIRVSGSFTYEFSLGAGELLAAFGVDPGGLSIEMTPDAEARMEATLAGVTEC
jgi:Flp pilus assembly protein TadG